MADERRYVSGDTWNSLPDPGEEILADPNSLRSPTEGSSSSTVADRTPTSSGHSPADEAAAATQDAQGVINSGDPEDSHDPTNPSGIAEEIDAQGPPPHYFRELKHQVFFHDAIVYIEGQDVSPFLKGAISLNYGEGKNPNKCDFILDNAGHRFTLTPENIQGEWRLSSPQTGPGAQLDYDESAKKALYDRKKDLSHNPVDPQSGGRRLPLNHWTSIFHTNDVVRVFIHDPASEADRWIPAFTGFVISKPTNEDYISSMNEIRVSCADIRHHMGKMRVNANTMLTVLPGTQATSAADPTGRTILGNTRRVFRPQSNRQFDTSYFTDLIRGSSLDNPWSALSLPDLVAALTFLPSSGNLVRSASERLQRRYDAETDEIRQEIVALAREIKPLQEKIDNGETLSDSELEEYYELRARLEENGYTDIPALLEQANVAPSAAAENDAEAGNAADPAQTRPQTLDGAEESDNEEATSESTNRQIGVNRGSGRIGRLRPGVFPLGRDFQEDVSRGFSRRSYWRDTYFPRLTRPNATSAQDLTRVAAHMQGWYALCLFGSPVRFGLAAQDRTRYVADDAPLDHSRQNRRYWTEAECHQAGIGSRREGAWHPEAQAVHFLSPAEGVPSTESIWELQTIAGQPVSRNNNWKTRLDMLAEASSNVEYRFWVSGSGDLIFEFAQYDFNPEHYGTFKNVLELNHHLISETFDPESGTIYTGAIANGSITGLADVPDGNIRDFVPNSIATWSPSLASRHGINFDVMNLPQIRDQNRLEQLAVLRFQKNLATADKYSLELAYRPWLTLNRPVFNQYRERIALIDSMSVSIPVTAGAIAGNNNPSTSLELNYTRSYDEVGVPRYITGGPGVPVYFGVRTGGATQAAAALNRRVRDIRTAVTELLEQGDVTEERMQLLRQRYRAILPQSQAVYNVIEATLAAEGDLDRPEGEENSTVDQVREVDRQLEEVTTNIGAFTNEERRQILENIRTQSEEIEQNIRASNDHGAPDHDQTPAGRRPAVGTSGVRTTMDPGEDVDPPTAPSAATPATCEISDPEMFGSPVGRATRTIPQWGLTPSSLRRRYNSGQQVDGDLQANYGVLYYEGTFPRVASNGFGGRREWKENARVPRGSIRWHQGIDVNMDLDELCYAVADGVVVGITDGSLGTSVYVIHRDGFASVYRHMQSVEVSLGDEVKRHAPLARCGYSTENSAGRSAREASNVHIHFECGVLPGSDAWNRWVGSGNRFLLTRSDRYFRDGSDPRRLASARCMVNFSGRGTVRTLTADQVSRLNLSFLASGGSFRIPSVMLSYNPIPVDGDPFSNPEDLDSAGWRRDTITNQRSYFEAYGLKGVPIAAVPAFSGVRRRSGESAQDYDRRVNAALTRFDADNINDDHTANIEMFRGIHAPEECPPEAYEGTTPRQPGEPLPTQARPTRTSEE